MSEIMTFNHRVLHEEEHTYLNERKVGGDGGKAPKYVIKCDKIFSSSMEKFKDCAPCDWIKVGGARITTFDSSGKLNGDTTISGKDPAVCMKNGPWGPVLQEFMYAGKELKRISIYQIMDIHNEKVKMQELNYSNCLIKTYDQEADKILFTFCFASVEDLQITYDHEGKKLGQLGMQFDFTTLEVKSPS